jgi:hypothetical protein
MWCSRYIEVTGSFFAMEVGRQYEYNAIKVLLAFHYWETSQRAVVALFPVSYNPFVWQYWGLGDYGALNRWLRLQG